VANDTSIVAAAFENESDARRALDALRQAGFGYDQVGVAPQGQDDINLKNDLGTLGVSDDVASYYDQQHSDGRTVVSVRPDGQDELAHSILHQYNGYDYEHQSGYNQTGSYATDTTTTDQPTTINTASSNTNYATTNDTVADRTASDYAQDDYHQPRSLRLRGEQLNVTKDNVQAGEVSLGKQVVSEQQTVNVPVTHEEVVIERHAYTDGQQTDDTPIGEGETIRVPVNAEQVNVSKDTYVTGEVSLGKRQVQENQQVTDTVRHEEARLNQQGNPIVQDVSNSNLGTATTADTTATTADNTATTVDNTVQNDVTDTDTNTNA
jgi:uncharacterized protein (TIGR02271 family)